MKSLLFLLVILSALPGRTLAINEKKLAVPFTSQAPTGEWVEPWQNACEETTMVMVNAYYTKKSLTPERAGLDISAVLNFKNDTYGKSYDESVEQVSEMINKHYVWQAEVKHGVTVEDIKSEIDKGHPVIIPFDARLVTNPHFSNPSPDYHTAVVIGYDDLNNFIVHDPGTSFGEAITYSYEELMKANDTYTIGDVEEKRGHEAIFTSPKRTMVQSWSGRFFQLLRAFFDWLFLRTLI